MADFIKTIKTVLSNEGAFGKKLGWNKTPGDAGGETVAGIARNMHPHWDGWLDVDNHKTHPNFPYTLNQDTILITKIYAFYKVYFWDKIGGDGIKSDVIALEILDAAVNEGFMPAIKRAEKTVGVPVTGVISTVLINKLNTL